MYLPVSYLPLKRSWIHRRHILRQPDKLLVVRCGWCQTRASLSSGSSSMKQKHPSSYSILWLHQYIEEDCKIQTVFNLGHRPVYMYLPVSYLPLKRSWIHRRHILRQPDKLLVVRCGWCQTRASLSSGSSSMKQKHPSSYSILWLHQYIEEDCKIHTVFNLGHRSNVLLPCAVGRCRNGVFEAA